MNKTCVLTVVYPGCEAYFDGYLKSFEKQSDQDFEFLFLNDGAHAAEGYLQAFDFSFQMKPSSGTITELRQELVQWALKEKAENIIFADADDLFDEQRIQVSKEMLSQHDLVFHDLLLFENEDENYYSMFGHKFREGQSLGANDFLTGNALGLSNTAMRARALHHHYRAIPKDTIAFDWMFFEQILRHGTPATYTRRTHTLYRQYASQTASPKHLSNEAIERGLDVKLQQYQFFNDEAYSQEVLKDFLDLHHKFHLDETFANHYCTQIRQQDLKHALWWEWIKLEKELNHAIRT